MDAMTDDPDVEPETEPAHERSWSITLETSRYADDRELLVEHAIEAVERTAAGRHVNLVTHAEQSHPSTYLYDELEARFAYEYEYVDQCGCGGHVVRVHVE